MSNVIELGTRRPHITGHAVCTRCGHDWVAVFQYEAKQLECPECETITRVIVFMGEITGIARFPGRSSDDDFEDILRSGMRIGKELAEHNRDD